MHLEVLGQVVGPREPLLADGAPVGGQQKASLKKVHSGQSTASVRGKAVMQEGKFGDHPAPQFGNEIRFLFNSIT